MTQLDNGYINYKDEIIRKLIHLFSLLIPIIYYFVTRETAILVLSILSLLALILDIARYINPKIGKLFYQIFGFMLRKHELDHNKKKLNGATYVLLSALLCVIIFPKPIFITAFSILVICDSSAALIGRKFGKRKFLSKSLEGTLAFFISGIIVIFITPKIAYQPMEYLIGFIGVAFGAIVENICSGITDDNLAIPVVVGFVIWILYLFLLPQYQLIFQNVPR